MKWKNTKWNSRFSCSDGGHQHVFPVLKTEHDLNVTVEISISFSMEHQDSIIELNTRRVFRTNFRTFKEQHQTSAN